MATEVGTRPRSAPSGLGRRLATETKAAFKTTEFWMSLAIIVAILISAAAIKGGDNGTDQFIARHAWLYVAIVTAGYAISRGLAKAGNSEPYWSDSGQNRTRSNDEDR